MVRNDNPDKGTEAMCSWLWRFLCKQLIRNDNPDKGTEAVLKTYYLQALLQVIRNDNPDKGTEAAAAAVASNPVIRLEMITPIRGRKGYYMIS